MARIHISNDPSGWIIVSFPYDSLLVAKLKTIDGRRWYLVEKHQGFPKLDGIIEKILTVYGEENIQIDPALQAKFPTLKGTVPDLRTGQSAVVESGLPPKYDFEEMRRELVSRKYSYKTIKGYPHYNKDLIRYAAKTPSDIQEADIIFEHVCHKAQIGKDVPVHSLRYSFAIHYEAERI